MINFLAFPGLKCQSFTDFSELMSHKVGLFLTTFPPPSQSCARSLCVKNVLMDVPLSCVNFLVHTNWFGIIMFPGIELLGCKLCIIVKILICQNVFWNYIIKAQSFDTCVILFAAQINVVKHSCFLEHTLSLKSQISDKTRLVVSLIVSKHKKLFDRTGPFLELSTQS